MTVSVGEAAKLLEERGMLKRRRDDHVARVPAHMASVLGRDIPADLRDFYLERIYSVGDFLAIAPAWNDWVGWRPAGDTELLPAQAVPIFSDGCGSLYGLDLSTTDDSPPVYFFDHEDCFETPQWAAGSTLGRFLLLLGEHDQAYREGRPDGWQLSIDPDIDKCPRAPAIWEAD
jgi:hypothetical protein